MGNQGMTIEDPRQQRTELRLKLYENGFSPLPNLMKACFLPEWSKLTVTPELIQSKQWARSRAWPDTGLRCGEIIGIDWDVNDESLINELLDAVIEAGVIDESPFVRVGKPPRELWVYRTSDKIGKHTTGAFVRGEDEEEKVEILGAGCQFAAFGQRDEHTAYQWADQSMLDAQYMDLPVITMAQVEALLVFAIAFFESKGLDRRSPMAGTNGGYNHEYDLTPDMVFDISEMGELSVEEIGDYLRLNPNDVLRCRVDALRPTSGSWAGMISLVHDAVCVSDHGTYTSHFPAEASLDDATSKLGALLAPRIAAAEEAAKAAPPAPQQNEYDYPALDTGASFDDNLLTARQRFVFVRDVGVVCDIGNSFLMQEVRTFRNDMANHYEVKIGKQNGETMVMLADLWMRDPQRVTVNQAMMRPDLSRPFFTDPETGQTMLNTYRPIRHTVGYGDGSIGMDMIDRLLPVPEERIFFKQWLCHKIRHPHERGQAIVMVAHDEYGTGRGSLFSLLRRVFGQRYTSSIDFRTLAGKTSQSQYNEWRTNSLLVTVDEAQDQDGASRWASRNNAYEALKDIVDPGEKMIQVVRKTIGNTQGISYASLIVATNHSDALVIPTKDRRFAVLENGRPQSEEYWRMFHAWMRDAQNIAAFVHDVLQTDLAGYSPHIAPPMTRSKLDMIDAGASDLDRVVTDVMATMPGRVAVKDQFFLHIEDYLSRNAIELHEDWRKTAEMVFRRKTRKPIGNERVVLESRTHYMRELPGIEGALTPAALRAELDKNGPVSRTLKSGGKIVNFPQR